MKIAIVGLLLCAPLASAQQPDTTELTRAQRITVADSVIKTVETYFAHWSAIPDLNKDSLYAWYRQAAADAPDRLAFDYVSLQFTSSLRNGHTNFDDNYQWQRFGGLLPFAASYKHGNWVLRSSSHNDLRVGDVITHVDGKPVERLFQEQRKYLAVSSEREARNLFFGRPYLFPNRMTLTLAGGRKVVVEKEEIDVPLLGTLVTHGYWIERGKIAYIRIPNFGQSHFEQRAIELVHEFSNAAAIIFDVRGNSGGSSPVHLTYTLTGPYRWFIIQIRDGTRGGPVTLPLPNDTLVAKLPRFHGKVALLIDGHCGSACDDFAMPIMVEKRGMLFGETTVGSSGQPRGFNNFLGTHFRASSRRQYFPDDGSEFEGVGVKPHVEVVPTPAEMKAGRDPVLRAALEWAAQ